MRVTFVTPGLTLSGGILAIIGFANGLADRGHAVSIVAPRAAQDPSVTLVGRNVKAIFTKTNARPGPGRGIANAWIALDLALATPASDALVATYTPTALPVLLSSHLGRGAPCWIYADYPEMFQGRPIESWLARNLPSRFRAVVTYSQASVDELAQSTGITATRVGLGLPNWRVLYPPAVSSARPPVALYVGDARPRKGLADFLNGAELARESVPSLRLLIVTKDPCTIATDVPFDHVIRPSDQDLADLYRQCGVFVSTSWFEGLGLPPLEAMACGAPVITTDQRGARDYARDGQNCLVVPIRSPEAVGRAIVRVLTDSDCTRRLSLHGLRTAEAYRWDPALDRFERVLQAAVSSSKVT